MGPPARPRPGSGRGAGPAGPASTRQRRAAGRGAGRDGAVLPGRAGVSRGERRRGEGDRQPPGPQRLFVYPPVHAQAGPPQHRVDRPSVRPARQGDRAGLGRHPDHRDRYRPGPFRRVRRGPPRVPAAGRRGVAGPGRDRARPGMLPAGPQQRRLAPATRDLRHDRDPDLRRRRALRPARL